MVMRWWGWGSENKQLDLSKMPKFFPYVENTIGCDITQQHKPIAFDHIQLPPPRLHDELLQQLSQSFRPDQVLQDKLERLRHAYGKSFRDLYCIRHGLVAKAPDLVIYPETTAQVSELLRLASRYPIHVIPFGGGTNIVGAVEAVADESRMIVSCDLTRMNKVLAIDEYSRTATIQAGALGPELEAQLNAKGFSLGHFPDSFQFSTLGGWLATRSVGMQSDQYGPISDMVLAMEVVTPQGVFQNNPIPYASCGPDIQNLFIGCEGSFGIITQATMKVHPLPEKEYFGAVLFPTFSDGIKAIQTCAVRKQLPHMMRLMDNDETQLSFNLKPRESRLKSFIQSLVKRYFHAVKRIKDDECACLILAFMGSPHDVRKKKKTVLAICRSFGGVFVGQSPGKAWYARKYDYPYLRDVVMDFGCVVDVAETSTTWSTVESLYQKIKGAGYQALRECTPLDIQNKIGRPGYVGCHISHNYYNGACLYFTFCFAPKSDQTIEQYWKVKQVFTQTIVTHGGALSHHHSIGHEHAPWLTQFIGTIGMETLTSLKQSIDPQGCLRKINAKINKEETCQTLP